MHQLLQCGIRSGAKPRHVLRIPSGNTRLPKDCGWTVPRARVPTEQPETGLCLAISRFHQLITACLRRRSGNSLVDFSKNVGRPFLRSHSIAHSQLVEHERLSCPHRKRLASLLPAVAQDSRLALRPLEWSAVALRPMQMLMAYIYWDVDPILIRAGPIVVHWYGLFFALAFLCGYFIVRWEFRVENQPERDLDSLLVYLAVGTVVGARLGHCLFYKPAYYLNHPLEVLEIWKGGLASHGGAAGILIALYFYTRKRPNQSYLWLLDRIVVPAALGGSFIRVGNLFNSEIIGKPTHVPWAFVFVRDDMLPRHPVQLYESAAYAAIFVLLLSVYRRLRASTPSGLLFGLFLVSVFGFRFFIEFLKRRQADYGHHLPLSVGQWLSIPFVIAGVILLWRAVRLARR